MENMNAEKEKRTKSYLDALLVASDPMTGERLSPRQTLRLAIGFMLYTLDYVNLIHPELLPQIQLLLPLYLSFITVSQRKVSGTDFVRKSDLISKMQKT